MWKARLVRREPFELATSGPQQGGVTVTEVEGRVAGQEIEIATTLDIGYPRTVAMGQHDRQGMVVMGAMTGLHLDQGVTGGLAGTGEGGHFGNS